MIIDKAEVLIPKAVLIKASEIPAEVRIGLVHLKLTQCRRP
jgi:hypothetical protein